MRGATNASAGEQANQDISIHAPREGCDTNLLKQMAILREISIHAPREGCDLGRLLTLSGYRISIHAPREGCDSLHDVMLTAAILISIHAPREGCDVSHVLRIRKIRPISIHAPREGCDRDVLSSVGRTRIISIHAPREGCDRRRLPSLEKAQAISIHAPREGCDRGNGLRIPRYGHSDHSLASIVLYNPLASPPDTQICRIEIPANHPLLSYQTARRTYTVFKSPQPWCEQPGTS